MSSHNAGENFYINKYNKLILKVATGFHNSLLNKSLWKTSWQSEWPSMEGGWKEYEGVHVFTTI